ncbi:chloride channel protein [Pedobacter gandavensis]|uniref:Chloride channel protein n=1 Tax=Pedobacter gandavensis TaxID=2679963 RepID=A0ABR6F295_9SPHI|nr:chloride channel protein [Pedobacter gandavensis]MBB2151654.1 chloride channel protein [Pedobacter gandavensis]
MTENSTNFLNSLARFLNQDTILRYLLKWTILSMLVGIAAGTLSALFLTLLNLATDFRTVHPQIIYLLPLAGFFIGLLYYHKGKTVERGNNLIFDTIHNPKDVIPFKMTPLVLFGTIITHLFGGSAGREGTALQMAAATADQLHKPFQLHSADRKILLIAGLSAGFAAVFGTPWAGAFFGIEVLLLGNIPQKSIFPAIASAFIGAYMTELWGVGHTHYHIDLVPEISMMGVIYSILAGLAFSIAAISFVRITDLFAVVFKRLKYAPVRPVVGGLVVLGIVLLLGTYKYIGLGIPVIVDAFHQPSQLQDFAFKILLTAITLAAGFKGGEVTPLFFIGATLGSALSIFLPLPVGLLAGMGFVAVFAGAAKTPIACCIMAFELFGISCGWYVAIACTVAFLASGHHSIYNAPENKSPKHLLFGRLGI